MLLTLALFACSSPAPAPATPTAVVPAERPVPAVHTNVLLITLDTTRADHLGSYGYDKGATPHLDALAARGQRFEWAYSPLPLTIPSHATLFTARDVYRHGVRNNGASVLREEETTLAERLHAAGYDTAATVAAFVTQRHWGFAQGFDAYFDDLGRQRGERNQNQWKQERPANEVVDDAVGWLQSRSPARPFFLWVHVYDVHAPWEPPPEYRERFGDQPYDAELAYVDAEVGRLLGALGPELDRTLVVAVADHGEGLGGHAELFHGLFTYNATQRVPWIMAGPGVPAGDVVTQPVGLVDVTPTILQRLGLPVPQPPDVDGRPQPGHPKPLYLESWQLTERMEYAPHVTVVDGPLKYIDLPRPELYHQLTDVRELEDLAPSRAEDVARFRKLIEDMAIPDPVVRVDDLDAEVQARLAALGYVSGDLTDVARLSLPDPKDRIPVIRALQAADRARSAKRPEQAEAELRKALELDPQLVEARIRLARMLSEQGRTAEARGWVEEAVAMRPDSFMNLVTAAMINAQAGHADRALELADQALAIQPDAEPAMEVKVSALFIRGMPEAAIVAAQSFLERQPDAAGVAGRLGVALARAGRMKEAAPLLARGLDTEYPREGVRDQVALFEAANGNHDGAVALLRAELADRPTQLETRSLLAGILAEARRYQDALAETDTLIRLDPTKVGNYARKVGLLITLGQLDAAQATVERGLALDPGHPEILLALANLQSKQGKQDLGQATFQRAQEALRQRAPTPSSPPR